MPLINDLWDKHKGSEIYIIGTGPSLRFFPAEFFSAKTITIGLNQAYKTIKNLTYNLTVHGNELIPNDFPQRNQVWITKEKGNFVAKKLPRQKRDRIFWFASNNNVKDYSYCKRNAGSVRGVSDCGLYVGRGIQTAALILAARMGARIAYLVGVDCSPLGTDHHATGQSVRFHGLPPMAVYREYYLNTREIRNIVFKEYGMSVVSLNPFIGLGYHNEDYNHLIESRHLERLPDVKDDSRYLRKGLDFQ